MEEQELVGWDGGGGLKLALGVAIMGLWFHFQLQRVGASCQTTSVPPGPPAADSLRKLPLAALLGCLPPRLPACVPVLALPCTGNPDLNPEP